MTKKWTALLLAAVLAAGLSACDTSRAEAPGSNLESGVSAIEDALPTAATLRELGFQTFIVDYRLSPYTQEEGALDAVPAHASAAGMIYSFYGRLSVGNMDPDWLAEGDLPPTFYVYGTEDPFYRQFQQQYDVIRNMGISTGRIVLNGWPHGFGSDGGWVNDYAAWLESVFANKEEF